MELGAATGAERSGVCGLAARGLRKFVSSVSITARFSATRLAASSAVPAAVVTNNRVDELAADRSTETSSERAANNARWRVPRTGESVRRKSARAAAE